jgi:UDP-N-acetyl-D-glucosamine dehydrogenase
MSIETARPTETPVLRRTRAELQPETEPLPVIPRTQFDYDVAIVGLGYVGLPTALSLHASGARVLGLDLSERRLESIRNGEADLLDSDRDRLELALIGDGFDISGDTYRLSDAAAVIICVPTPIDEHSVPDLAILRAACSMVVDAAIGGQLLLLTSTTYAGCTRDLLMRPLQMRGLSVGRDVFVAFSPERIDPGNAGFAHEDVPRVVGGATEACQRLAVGLLGRYARSVHSVSSLEAAEMTKLLENTFRAVNIALANEFAEACRVLEVPVMEVIAAAATKPYGFMPFSPGPGVGGHCIPCDPHYLLWQLRKSHITLPVIEQAMAEIAGRPRRVVERIRQILADHSKPIGGSRVLVIGVSYKPDVADLRESPALEILSLLDDLGAEIAYHDPNFESVMLSDGIELEGTLNPAAFDADLVLVHTDHSGSDLSWIPAATSVLDATYRRDDVLERELL